MANEKEYRKKEEVWGLPYPKNLYKKLFDKDIRLPTDVYGTLVFVLGTLPEDERNIIELRYSKQMTMKQIGDEYGMGPHKVRPIIDRAVRKLKNSQILQYLTDGLDIAIFIENKLKVW